MKIQICAGSVCTMKGSDTIFTNLENLKEEILPNMEIPEGFDLEIELIKCRDRCKDKREITPCVYIDDKLVERATSQRVMSVIMDAIQID